MTLGSLFAGIGGFDLGFERAGFETKWQVEIDPFCTKILERHFPKAKRYGDITKLDPTLLEKVDVITGGFPCQDLSVAGKRKGLGGERSGLFYELKRIIAGVRPAWFVVENVPGLFSSQRGRDFGLVLFHLAECGYGLAWRILDSRYFGVAQQRRRVFIVGCLGKPCPPEILFDKLDAKYEAGIRTGLDVPDDQISDIDDQADRTRTVSILAERIDGDGRAIPNPDRNGKNTRISFGVDLYRGKALGNAVTVNVAEWIARRIVAWEKT